ncbi:MULTISPECIES: hypothetical protein [Roseomonas]|jgi:hypothetical protein|uniref:hypothetical protein n=1 Tax=Roseomonas TaxID=125216 RepID=UPI00111532EA|nr:MULTISPECIES: hypothetical protein [Roseomonas]USQ74363.1 hypothetical protein NF552_24550 [Roseomonas mucosa]
MLVDVRARHALAWDASLKPIGEGSLGKEPFEAWWARNHHRLTNLHPLVAEQWVYKCWRHSPFCHLPLECLSCRVERWTVERILRDVAWGMPDSDEDPEFNFRVFHGKEFEPGRTMDATGTWNIPPVILEAPDGLLTDTGEHPETRYWLIEGHQRRRYLHALAFHQVGGGQPGFLHEVFLLSIRDARSAS